MVSTQTIVADWFSKSNRFHAFPTSLKSLEEEEEVFTVILVQPDQTAHLEREYVQLIDWCWECCDISWRTMGVWMYMRWHDMA